MPRSKTIRIGALNIKTHPHSTEKYVELLKDIFKLNRAVEFRANHYAILGTLNNLEKQAPEEGVYGYIYRFLDFDRTHPWLNLDEHKAADEKDLRSVKIPDHLKPNLLMFTYAFFPKKHQLFFESNSNKASLTPNTAKKIFELQFKHPEILKKYGDTDVIIVPEKEQLERILAIPKLTKLQIVITRPNPDDQDEFEAQILRRLNIQHAGKYESSLTAIRGERLQPDDQTTSLAKVGSLNGSVEGHGKDNEGRAVTESTLDHPMVEVVTYNPNVQSRHEVFIGKARTMLRKILGQ